MKSKIRVLHVTNAFPSPEHPEYGVFIKDQINSLHASVDQRVFFINARDEGSFAYLRCVAQLKTLCDWAEVIHCHHVFCLLVLKVFLRPRKKIVTSFLNDWTREIKLPLPEAVKSIVCQFAVGASDAVIFKSFPPLRYAESKKVKYLPNGVDPDFFEVKNREACREVLGWNCEIRYLLFVSSKNIFRRQKRFDIFTEVVSILNDTSEEKFEGVCVSDDTRETYRLKLNACDAHLLVSDFEGSPNSVKEALSSGVRVFARDVGNVSDLLAGVHGCVLLQSNDAPTIAESIRLALTSEVNRGAVRSEFLEKGFTEESIGLRLFAIYKELTHVGSSENQSLLKKLAGFL